MINDLENQIDSDLERAYRQWLESHEKMMVVLRSRLANTSDSESTGEELDDQDSEA